MIVPSVLMMMNCFQNCFPVPYDTEKASFSSRYNQNFVERVISKPSLLMRDQSGSEFN